MHFYIHTLPLDAPVLIPAPISVPLLQVCEQLQLPPVLTYSDDVLYNWAFKSPPPAPIDGAPALPTTENITTVTTFTQTPDEDEFYLSSARIELRGVEALELMRATMDEAFVGDDLAFARIAAYLASLADVVGALSALLLRVRERCDPDVFYHQIRPWFRGEDSAAEGGRKWVFEGIDEHGLKEPVERSGPSAGQSALVHALDIFLGVDEYSHHSALTGRSGGPAPPTPSSSSSASTSAVPPDPQQPAPKPFLTRMQSYMPRHHRAFLRHLSANPRPLRALVTARAAAHPALLAAYNAAVRALKGFRDAHMRIVALYIVGPSAREGRVGMRGEKGRWLAEGEGEETAGEGQVELKGTGGTELVRFLKGVRDRTAGAVIDRGYEVEVEVRGKVISI
jgi:indoleamine 2,3-dioxygenase